MSPKSKKIKILICDPLDEAGVEIFKSADYELIEAVKASTADLKKMIQDVDAAVVRSGTTLTGDIIECGKKLRIIGRAGVGIDNVDVESASKLGIAVVNTPSGNTISAAEHTMSLMLAMSRNIAPAHQSMSSGKWDRKKFLGVELLGKTLGLIGLGRIGAAVARRAQSFEMKVVAYDPFLRADKALELGVEQATLDEVFSKSDFISMHVPLTKETRNILDAKAFSKMKKNVRIINCARGGLIDEDAALKAIQSGKVAGMALDVYEQEPPAPSKFLEHPQVLKTPHLGASTQEAQIKVSVDVAKTIVDYLSGRGIRNAVNVAMVDPRQMKELEPYFRLAEGLGSIVGGVSEGQFKGVDIRYAGHPGSFPTSPLTACVLKGLLQPILDDNVNEINATFIAKDRGIRVSESTSEAGEDFSNLIEVRLKTDKGTHSVAGSLFRKNDPRIVMFDQLRVESTVRGSLLIIENEDVPGIVGLIGQTLGNNKINIADMSVGRDIKKKIARIIISIDAPVSDKLLKELRSKKHILNAKYIQLS